VLVGFDVECPVSGIVSLIEEELTAALAAREEQPQDHESDQLRDHAAAARAPTLGTPLDTAARALGNWHSMSGRAVLDALHSSPTDGLSPTEVANRLERDGANSLPRPEGRSPLAMLTEQFASAPVGLLAASAAVSVFTGGVIDAALIAGVLVANGLIGFFTELHADRTISSLGTTETQSATVVREGARREVPVEQLVAGDIVVLSPGSYVPADVRVLEARHLTIDESTLTGESMPISKSPDAVDRAATALADRTNMAYMGTLVTGGSGRGVLVATGRRTELGTIHGLVGNARQPETPLERHLDTMGTQLVLVSSGLCAAVFGMGVLHGFGALEMLLISTSLAVAAVPEGLPAVATTTLALGIRDMRRKRVLIRRLDAVENLGAIQIVCLDKTGTLTRNEMAVTAVHADGLDVELAGGRQWPADPRTVEHLRRLLQIGVLCNESEAQVENGSVSLRGSATENALIALAMDAGIDVADLRRRCPLLDVRYRTEKYRYMTTLHEIDGGRLLAVKGNPTEVLAMCRWQAGKRGRTELTNQLRTDIMRANERMAGRALRVLGLAYAEAPASTRPGSADLTWLGLVGMMDPLRPGMPELIRRFHRAGIETVMITGDQSATAYAVGRQLHLANGQPLEILDSESLERLDPQLLSGLAQRVRVFARVSPAHKLEIVQALQGAGKVVAMTGDGVNDGPALRAADIGLVVGDGSTELARSVADVVIEGDDLHSALVAVGQGRTIRDNVRKALHFLVATNLSEMELVFGAVAIGVGSPLGPMQLLWINLVTDVLPGVALSREPPEPDVLDRAPRDPREPILGTAEWKRIGIESGTMAGGALASYVYGLARYGAGAQASTCAFMSLTLAQLSHAVSCRSPERSLFDGRPAAPNHYLTAGLGVCFGLQALAVFFPPLRGLLGLAPIGLLDALAIGVSASVPFLLNEATKPRKASRAEALGEQPAPGAEAIGVAAEVPA
jgi:Ca2+-transporting ATPase